MESLQLHAKKRSAYITIPARARLLEDNQETILDSKKITGSDELRKMGGYFQEVEYFIRCLREDIEPEISFGNTIVSMQMIDLVLNLFKQGKNHWKGSF